MSLDHIPHSPTRGRRIVGPLLMIAGLLSLAGCGNGLASVSGQVTLNGSPLAASETVRGTVYFFPEGGTGVPAVGLVDAEGEYSLSTGSEGGVSPGAYLVTISASELIPPKIPGEAPGGRPITPRKYANPAQSGFRVQVAAGSNVFDFALEGKPTPTRNRSR